MSAKKQVLVLCGGKSDEHEISLISAKYILDALDRSKFEPIVVGIAKDGTWHLHNEKSFYKGEVRADKISLNTDGPRVWLAPYRENGKAWLQAEGKKVSYDVAFPVLHGPFGEDGTIQGLFEIVDVPYVGANCGVSWIGMDKNLAKSLCKFHHIPAADFVSVKRLEELEPKLPEVRKLGLPVFVKPAKMGSSVGITKVKDWNQLTDAVKTALRFDNCCLIEKAVVGRELECAVLGLAASPRASLPGEVIVSKKAEFYSYDAKYLSQDSAEIVIPAKLDPPQVKAVQEFCKRVYTTLEVDGMARVDLFLLPNGEIYLNEINTIPGFTPISMYPKMWKASGLEYPELLTELLSLAFQRKGLSL